MNPIQNNAQVHLSQTRARHTPPSGRGKFKAVMDGSANALISGVEAASAMAPAGHVVSAAVRSARADGPATRTGGSVSQIGAASQSAAGPGTESTAVGGMASAYADDSLRLIMLQQQIQSENRNYTAMSNVMKARHETSKNAINNIR